MVAAAAAAAAAAARDRRRRRRRDDLGVCLVSALASIREYSSFSLGDRGKIT